MTEGNRDVTVELKANGDYKTVLDILERHHLHPAREDWPLWRPGGRRRITFTFHTSEGAAIATAALSDFLPA